MTKNEQLSHDDEGKDSDEVAVIVHLDRDHHCIGSTLLTNFYRYIAKFKLNSNIIVQDNIAISNEIIFHTKHHSQSTSPQLLYRGSRDGFKAEDFHSRCDDQGPTLTIIKSSSEPYNQIFGGFTTQSWNSPSQYGEWISDDSAFIFKINDVENSNQLFRKFNIKQDKTQHAIYNSKHYLTIFGFGHDLCLVSDCNLNNNSSSNFGFTYELLPTTTTNNDDELHYGGEKARNYLAGSYHFKVSEIEVFKIIITTTSTQYYKELLTVRNNW